MKNQFQVVELGYACADCADYINFGSEAGSLILSGSLDAVAQNVTCFLGSGQVRPNEELRTGEDTDEFSSSSCDVCGSHLGGSRVNVYVLRDSSLLNFSLHRERLNSGGYNAAGRYFGQGMPLYYAAADDVDGRNDIGLWIRAYNRQDAMQRVLDSYPTASFLRNW